MSEGTPLVCPIEPHQMDKRTRQGFEDLVRRVVCANTMRGVGHDLLLRVYLSGIFHGVELANNARDNGSQPKAEDSEAG